MLSQGGGGGGITLRAQNFNNMAALGEDYFTSDDLDCILDIINEDFAEESEEFNAELDELLSDITCHSTSVNVSCNQCDKVCKTKQGCSKPTNVKHPQLVLKNCASSVKKSVKSPEKILRPLYFKK